MKHGPADARAAGWRWTLWRLFAFSVLFIALGVVFGMVWAALPANDDPVAPLLGTAVTAIAATLAGTVMLRAADGRRPAALGIGLSGETARHVLLGFGIGAAAMGAAVLALVVTRSAAWTGEPGTAGVWLRIVAAQGVGFTVAAFAEEALFRGYPFQVLARATSGAIATVATAALFAAAHAFNPEVGVLALLNIFLAGIMLGVAYLRTLSLWFATAVHVGWNWTMASLFDLPVSGIAAFDTPLYEPAVGGPTWWSGGAFGPEGGLVSTLGVVLALVLLRLRAVRRDPAALDAGALVMDNGGEQE